MSLWLLGGHDPTHGAGLYRDLVTARRLAPNLNRQFAVTAFTDQGKGRPASAQPVPASRLRARVQRWSAPQAIKVGLVPDPLASVVAELIAGHGVAVVVDPVIAASDGGALGATPHGLAPLLAAATLITPNRPEALALLDEGPVESGELARRLGARFSSTAILLKGGHGTDPQTVCDWLVHAGSVLRLERPRVGASDPRGTGCALATAIAAHLARGATIESAVHDAVHWLDEFRRDVVPGPDGRAHLRD